MSNFIPDFGLNTASAPIPFFEDSQKHGVPGRGTTKTINTLQDEIASLLLRLDAFSIYFVPGIYPGQTKRYGFQIFFQFATAKGRLDCAALPIRKETPTKKNDAQKQALYLLRNELEAMLFARIYKPGAFPLVPYLIGEGNKTVTEALIERGNLPALTSGGHHG